MGQFSQYCQTVGTGLVRISRERYSHKYKVPGHCTTLLITLLKFLTEAVLTSVSSDVNVYFSCVHTHPGNTDISPGKNKQIK